MKVLAAWLDEMRTIFLYEIAASRGITASAFGSYSGAVDNMNAALRTWNEGLTDELLPEISVVFGEAFQRIRRGDEFNSAGYEQDYLEQVESRLKMWPDGAFEDIRPELLEAMDQAESFDEIRDRVGRVLDIDAPTRRLREQITAVDEEIKREGPRSDLKRRRRELWQAHDASLGEWRYNARRIARTEAHGAREAGQLAAARQMEQADGGKFYKRWLDTNDERTRPTHNLADGQMVRISESFLVGGFYLDCPGDPTGPPQEIIQCRCDTLILDEAEAQEELQGPEGSNGEIAPGGVRLGPDDPDDAQKALEELIGREVKQGRGERPEPVVLPPAAPPVAELDLDQALAELEAVNEVGGSDEYVSALLDRIDALEQPDAADYDPFPVDEPAAYDIVIEAEPAKPWAPEQIDQAWGPIEDDIIVSDVDKAIAELEAVTSDPNATDEQIEEALAKVDAAELAETEHEAQLEADAAAWERALEQTNGNVEGAEALIAGMTMDEQRIASFIEEHYRLYGTRSFEKLARLVARDRIANFWLIEAEAATNGHMIKPEYQNTFDPLDLWLVNEATARKYMSKEAAKWFDENGRTSPAEFMDMILTGDYSPRAPRSGRDYLQ